MSPSIVEILMERDGLDEDEAMELIDEARCELDDRVENGEMAYDLPEKYFGLGSEYLDELEEIPY